VSAPGRPIYHEAGRSYASAVVLSVLIVLGFLADLLIGGGRAHLIAWIVALAVVVGIDLIAVHAARTFGSVTVTDTALTVGEESVARERLVAIERKAAAEAPILGRTRAAGMPRGKAALAVRLTDGSTLLVPTRRPDRLAEALSLSLDVLQVRPAEPADAPAIGEIERGAAALFRVAGLEFPGPWSDLTRTRGSLAMFVCGEPPVGFVQLTELDGAAHIEQLAVLPGRMRSGLGGALLEAAWGWARERGRPAITITIYPGVEPVREFFRGHGFAETSELGPELLELRDWERAIGLDAAGERVVLRREL
jgi:ribosomal protein S18 acetylase RimI-like enzyme